MYPSFSTTTHRSQAGRKGQSFRNTIQVLVRPAQGNGKSQRFLTFAILTAGRGLDSNLRVHLICFDRTRISIIILSSLQFTRALNYWHRCTTDTAHPSSSRIHHKRWSTSYATDNFTFASRTTGSSRRAWNVRFLFFFSWFQQAKHILYQHDSRAITTRTSGSVSELARVCERLKYPCRCLCPRTSALTTHLDSLIFCWNHRYPTCSS